MCVRANIRPSRTRPQHVILSERLAARRSFGSGATRNGQNQAPWRAGIYEGVFVTFYRQSYFPHKTAGVNPRPTLRGAAPTLTSLCRGRGTTKWWWESFKGKVTFPRTRVVEVAKRHELIIALPQISFRDVFRADVCFNFTSTDVKKRSKGRIFNDFSIFFILFEKTLA